MEDKNVFVKRTKSDCKTVSVYLSHALPSLSKLCLAFPLLWLLQKSALFPGSPASSESTLCDSSIYFLHVSRAKLGERIVYENDNFE